MAETPATQQAILDYLATHELDAAATDAGVDMGTIATAIDRSTPTVSRHLSALRTDGLVAVTTVETGHRPRHLHTLTDAGRDATSVVDDHSSTDATEPATG